MPPKSPGQVQVPTSMSLIHSVMSDGHSGLCCGASEQISTDSSSVRASAPGGRLLGNAYST
jgi:hypothetical protein